MSDNVRLTSAAVYTVLFIALAWIFLRGWLEAPSLFLFPSLPEARSDPVRYVIYAALDLISTVVLVKLAEGMSDDEEITIAAVAGAVLFLLLYPLLLRCFALLVTYTCGLILVAYNPAPASTTPAVAKPRSPQRRRRPKRTARARVKVRVSRVRVARYALVDSLTGRPIRGPYYYACPYRFDHVFDEDSARAIVNRYGDIVCPFCEGMPRLKRRRLA